MSQPQTNIDFSKEVKRSTTSAIANSGVSLLFSLLTYGQTQISITDSNLLNLATITGTGILAFGLANSARINWSDRTAYRTAELMQGLQTSEPSSAPKPADL